MGTKQWIRKILNGGMNTDQDIRSVLPPFPAEDYLDSENTRLAAIDGGYYNSRVSLKGNLEVPNILPEGDNKCIGVYEDRVGNTLIVFNYNSNGNDGVYQYMSNGIWAELLLGDMGFTPDILITGVDLIDGLLYWVGGRQDPVSKECVGKEPRMINVAKANDYLKNRIYNIYFQESDILDTTIDSYTVFISIFNPEGVAISSFQVFPLGTTVDDFLADLATKINDETGLITAEACDCHLSATLVSQGKYTMTFVMFKTTGGVSTTSYSLPVPENFYPSPVKDEYISRVKYSPLIAPTGVFKTDVDFKQNFVAKKYFQFSTQYIYDNNEYSCISVISKMVFNQSYCGTEGVNNNYVELNFYDIRLNNANSLSILKKVNILVREGESPDVWGSWKLVDTLERCDFNISPDINGSGTSIYKFYNDGNYPVMADELVQADNFHPLISTAQTMAQNRGYLGGNLEGYDNVDCVDASAEVSYTAPCANPVGTVSGKIYIQNPTNGEAWAGRNFQPLIMKTGSPDPVYGGINLATVATLDDYVDMEQVAGVRGFIVYSAQDPQSLNTVSVQTAPSGVTIAPGDGNIYDPSDIADIRTAMAAGEVYSTYSLELPIGKHIIRIAGNAVQPTFELGFYYSYPGELWHTTSIPTKTFVGGTNYYHEAVVEVTEGGVVTLDIYLYDFISISGTETHSVVCGYMMDGETSSEVEVLNGAPRCERQDVTISGMTNGWTLYKDGFNDLGLTDQNGFFWKLYRAGSATGGASIKIEGADGQDAVANADVFYGYSTADPEYGAIAAVILNGLAGAFDYTTITSVQLLISARTDYVFYNHYQAYSDNCRTQIKGKVKNSDGIYLAGVNVLATLTNRIATTDGGGNYELLVYANIEEGTDKRTAYLFYKTGSTCCIEYPNGENKVVVVTPFTPDANYSINFPYLTDDFLLNIDGFDIERQWKHRNNVKLGIVYMDVAGRTSRVQPIPDLFIPFMTDIDGNIGAPVVEWLINHKPPVWAVKYQIVVQKNPYYNRYEQFIVGEVSYVKLWDYTTEPPTIIPTTFESGEATEITMSMITLVNYTQENTGALVGYIPEKGDRMTFIRDSDGVLYTELFDFEIESRGQGTFEDPTAIIIKYNTTLPEIKVGTLIEFYTPKKKTDLDFYFGWGEVYSIGDAGLSTRYHKKGKDGQDQTDLQPATGFIYDGDTFYRPRKMFVLDGTEPNYYEYKIEDQKIYDNDANSQQLSVGTPNIVDPEFRQFFYTSRIRFSGLYNTDGNKLFNGLSSFQFPSYRDADQIYGCIQRLLRLGGQAQLLAIQNHKVTSWVVDKAIVYELKLSEGTLAGADSPLQFAQSFTSPFGSQHAESVVIDGNNVWAWDMFEGVVWYHNSGDLISISDKYNYKKKVNGISQELLDYNQSRVHIIGAINRNFEEVIWAVEKVLAVDPPIPIGDIDIGDAEDNPDPGARMVGGELVDFDPVTLVFALTRDRWETRLVDYYPDFMIPLGGNRFFAFKEGQMWEDNINPLCSNFFGVQSQAKIVFPLTDMPQMIKDWYALREKANKVWACIDIFMPPNSRYPNGMRSRITKNNFYNFEGDLWAQFLKDMSDSSFVSELQALQRGRELKGDVMIITLENKDTSQAYLNEIDINWTPSQQTM